MDFEHSVKEFPLDEKLEAELKKLADEGWGLVPGTKPVATYQLVRIKQNADMGAKVDLGIDDSKVHILRNGQIVG